MEEINDMGATVLEKANKETKSSIVQLDKKLTEYTDQELSQAKEALQKDYRASIDLLKEETSIELRAVKQKIMDIDR